MVDRTGGHNFSGTIKNSNGVHLGDVHNYHPAERGSVADKIRQALFLTDPTLDRAALITAKGELVDGTCAWILQDAAFKSWLSSDSDLLCIAGGPGKGKTMLSVFLTEHLAKDQNLIYYFCTFQDQRRNHVRAILRGLLFQILSIQPGLATKFSQHFETYDRTQVTLASPEALWDMLTSAARSAESGRFVCLIDGLDECDQESNIFLTSKLRALVSSKDPGMPKFIIATRGMKDVGNCFRITLDLAHNGEVRSDVEAFIESSIGELRQFPGCTQKFVEAVASRLLQRSQGTFLWVGFAVLELLTKTTCMEVEETLQSLPEGLSALYDRMLLNIDARRRETAAKIIRWTTFTKRPLTLQELSSLLEISETDFNSRLQFTADTVRLCGPLLVIVEDTVHLVHQSAVDYLLIQSEHSTLRKFKVGEVSGHTEILQYCINLMERILTYQPIDKPQLRRPNGSPFDNLTGKWLWLNLHWLNTELLPDMRPRDQRISELVRRGRLESKVRSMLETHGMLEYAIQWWPQHAIPLPRTASTLFNLPFFQNRSRTRINALEAYRQLWSDRWGDEPIRYLSRHAVKNSISTACFFGILPWVVAHFWRSNTTGAQEILRDQNPMAYNDYQPFIIAVEREHIEVVRFLLGEGADVNMRNREEPREYTVLHAAAACDSHSPAILRLLLESGAEVDAKDGNGETALHVAALGQAPECVQLLLENGADVHDRNNDEKTPLHNAAYRSSSADVALLLAAGSNPNVKDFKGTTPLHEAATSSPVHVRLLLDSGSDVDTVDVQNRIPLHCAARDGGSSEEVKLLIQAGANIEAKESSSGMTVLLCAASSGSADSVQAW